MQWAGLTGHELEQNPGTHPVQPSHSNQTQESRLVVPGTRLVTAVEVLWVKT